MAEHEAISGSKPSPSKSGKKASRCSTVVPSIRKFSVGGAMFDDPKPEKAALVLHSNKKGKEASKVVGDSVKKVTDSTAKETESQSPLMRKPPSPVSTRVLSQANIADFQEDQRTPSKPITSVGHSDNRTPKNIGIPAATTPLTSASMMLTAATPDAPPRYSSGAA